MQKVPGNRVHAITWDFLFVREGGLELHSAPSRRETV